MGVIFLDFVSFSVSQLQVLFTVHIRAGASNVKIYKFIIKIASQLPTSNCRLIQKKFETHYTLFEDFHLAK